MKNNSTDNDLALKTASIGAAVSLAVYIISIFACQLEYPRTLVSNLLLAVPVAAANILLTRSYIAHNKNITKSLIGFILSGLVMMSMLFAFSYLDPAEWSDNAKAILFLVIGIFTVNQLLLANDHYGRPAVLFINQLLMDFMTIFSIVVVLNETGQFAGRALIYLSLLAFVLFTMFLVLKIEMKVNERKLERRERGFVFVKKETGEEVLEEEDMFISNRLFDSLPWIVSAGLIGLIIFNAVFDTAITWGYSIRYLIYLIKLSCLFSAIHMYRSYSKDGLKILLGFLLGTLLFENICEITFISTSSVTSLKSIATMAMVLANLFFVLVHLQLTQTHAGSEKIVKRMKTAYVVYIVLAVIVAADCSIYYFLGKGANYGFFMFKPILWLLGTFPVITGIVTIDTRINGFRLKREYKA